MYCQLPYQALLRKHNCILRVIVKTDTIVLHILCILCCSGCFNEFYNFYSFASLIAACPHIFKECRLIPFFQLRRLLADPLFVSGTPLYKVESQSSPLLRMFRTPCYDLCTC